MEMFGEIRKHLVANMMELSDFENGDERTELGRYAYGAQLVPFLPLHEYAMLPT